MSRTDVAKSYYGGREGGIYELMALFFVGWSQLKFDLIQNHGQ